VKLERAAIAVATALLGACEADTAPSVDQRSILEAIASDETGALCLKPRIGGSMSVPWARRPPRGFDDLAEHLTSVQRADLRLAPGSHLGRVLISDNRDCFEALVPYVSGNRAAAALLSYGLVLEFGLRREGGRWVIVERSQPDI
jgi:hypothetical protein